MLKLTDKNLNRIVESVIDRKPVKLLEAAAETWEEFRGWNKAGDLLKSKLSAFSGPREMIELLGGVPAIESYWDVSVWDSDELHISYDKPGSGLLSAFYRLNSDHIYIHSVGTEPMCNGLVKPMFAGLLRFTDRIGCPEWSIGALQIGRYVWAKAGFVRQKDSIDDWEKFLDEELAIQQADSDTAARFKAEIGEPDPYVFWRMADSKIKMPGKRNAIGKAILIRAWKSKWAWYWDGKLDLTDAEQRSRLENWLGV